MVCLGVETSSFRGSLSLFRVQGTDSRRSIENIDFLDWKKNQGHSESITLKLQLLLDRNKLFLKDLQLLCIGQGPGSFTGLRVGVNLVRTLSYSFGIPIFAVNSLRLLSQPALQTQRPVLAMVNAYAQMLYVAAYQKLPTGEMKTLKEPQAVSLDLFNNSVSQAFVCVGDGYETYSSALSPRLKSLLDTRHDFAAEPSALDFGAVFLEYGSAQALLSWNQLIPLYIRASQAEEKSEKGLLKPLPKLF